jgi:hypothetical protein
MIPFNILLKIAIDINDFLISNGVEIEKAFHMQCCLLKAPLDPIP